MSSPHEALEAFAERNPDLTRLEDLLSKFNLFEAIGVVRQELRHSNLLAFLLDPGQSHGLGAIFLKELLQSALLQTDVESPISSPDLDSWKLDAVTVQREWHHIDILVVDDVNRFAVIIENKIDTGEHSDQLDRYYRDVHSHYPGYKTVALHLTPDGDAPSSSHYHTVSYTQVCQVAERLVVLRRPALGSDVVMLLEHYAQMLRRHIVSDSDVAELCRSIYQKHRQALDLIFEHRPDQQAQIGQYAKSLIQQNDLVYQGTSAKKWITFGLNEWRGVPRDESRPFYVYFEFHNLANDLKIFCTLAPGDPTDRARLFQMAQKQRFTGCQSKLSRGPCRLAVIQVLRADDYDKTQEEIEAMILKKWTVFLSDELPRMAQAIREERWLWTL